MKRLSIEKLLQWTFQEELPKREFLGPGVPLVWSGGGWDAVLRAGETGAHMISDGRPQAYAVHLAEAPHADALLIEEALVALSGGTPVLHEAPSVLVSDMAPEVGEAVEALVGEAASGEDTTLPGCRWRLGELVCVHASLGRRPGWQVETPKCKPVRPSNWKGSAPPAYVRRWVKGPMGSGWWREEIAKMDPRSRRLPKDAYRKYTWEPKLEHIIRDRAEWLVWRAMLEAVRESVAGRLGAHEVSGEMPPERPWELSGEDGEADIHRAGRVLPDLSLAPGGTAETAPSVVFRPREPAPRRRRAGVS
ncbi:hypothetical protein [Afifella sp. IM 167]|uniref:hypothetical protein n=1 Tax=Afifella sp. IM 167 TaxID=2033586 RepID=UPI001CCC509A|nr:hypothetical protein [Afifella sp. IM 167]MBZ8133242.1 hypothetical protein [Afifella sp. IM 167]